MRRKIALLILISLAFLLIANGVLLVKMIRFRRQRDNCRAELQTMYGHHERLIRVVQKSQRRRDHLLGQISSLKERLIINQEIKLQKDSARFVQLFFQDCSEGNILRKPQERDLAISTNEDREYLSRTLRKIFSQPPEEYSPKEKCLHILRFVASYHILKRNAGTATKILKDGHAICGGLTVVFVNLVRAAGLPARHTGLHNLPGQGGHSAAEVYYQGKWHFFDPTFGIFFSTLPTAGNSGQILSLREMILDPQRGNLMAVVEHPWQGFEAGDNILRVHQVGKLFTDRSNLEPFPTKYRQLLQKAFPVTFGKPAKGFHPIVADLTTTRLLSIGKKNNSHRDMASANATHDNVGFYYVGGRSYHVLQPLVLKLDRPGPVTVEFHRTGTYQGKLELIPLMEMHVANSKRDRNKTSFTIHCREKLSIGLMICSDDIFFVDQIRVQKGNNALARN